MEGHADRSRQGLVFVLKIYLLMLQCTMNNHLKELHDANENDSEYHEFVKEINAMKKLKHKSLVMLYG